MKRQIPAWAALLIISLVAGLLLALTNELTKDQIAEQAIATANAARASVLPGAEEFRPVELNEAWLATLPVDNCYEGLAGDQAVGYVSQITVKGYAGPIEVIVGMDAAGALTGVSVGGSGFKETAGLGAETRERAFTGQFAGIVPPAVLRDNVDGVTGASISSGAVVSAVNKASSYMYFEAGLLDESADAVRPVETRVVVAQGFAGEIEVSVGLDKDGAIVSLQVGGANFNETAGLGAMAQEKSFTDQFIGKSGTVAFGEGVDAIAGATITSDAVLQAINEALAQGPVSVTPRTETVQGFAGEIEVSAVLDKNGAIASLEVGGANFNETAGLGAMAREKSFTDQFIGKSGTVAFGEGVDAIAGATITSDAVLQAINAILSSADSAPQAPAEEPLAEEPTAEPTAEPEPEATEEPAQGMDVAVIGGADGPTAVFLAGSGEQASAKGFAGDVTVVVNKGEGGEIAELVVVAIDETAGIGQKVMEKSFTDQFIGKTGPFKYGEGVDAIAGATVTSDAVLEALNSLYAEPEAPAEALSAAAKGFAGDVTVRVTLDEAGAVAEMTVDAQNETPGIGQNAMEYSFTDQFIGKTGPFKYGEGVDAIAGATVTSDAVLEAINALMAG